MVVEDGSDGVGWRVGMGALTRVAQPQPLQDSKCQIQFKVTFNSKCL